MYSKKHNFYLLFSAIICFNVLTVYGQNIKGKILDINKTPIPYATVQIGPNYGVVTNTDGAFSIDISAFDAEDSVEISCLGYKTILLKLKAFSKEIYFLEEHSNKLSEVFLSNKAISLDSILFKTKSNLKKNYKFKSSEYEIFSRRTEHIDGKKANIEIVKSEGFSKKQLKSFNKDFDKLEESLLNNTTNQYAEFIGKLKTSANSKTKLDVLKAIEIYDEENSYSVKNIFNRGNEIMLKNLDKNKVYTVKSGLFTLSDSISFNNHEQRIKDSINSIPQVKNIISAMIKEHVFIDANEKIDFILDQKKYDYEITDTTFIDNELIYIIAFTPKRASAIYHGTVHISSETFAVLKMTYGFYENRIGKKINLKFLLGLKYIEKNRNGLVVYKKGPDGFYYPKYISEKVDRYFYIKRPTKFTANDNRKNKVSFKLMAEGVFKEKTEVLVLSRADLSPSAFNSYNEKKKINFDHLQNYDPSYWKEYNILEPIKEIKSFEIPN